jgi:hypothetical protein
MEAGLRAAIKEKTYGIRTAWFQTKTGRYILIISSISKNGYRLSKA